MASSSASNDNFSGTSSLTTSQIVVSLSCFYPNSLLEEKRDAGFLLDLKRNNQHQTNIDIIEQMVNDDV